MRGWLVTGLLVLGLSGCGGEPEITVHFEEARPQAPATAAPVTTAPVAAALQSQPSGAVAPRPVVPGTPSAAAKPPVAPVTAPPQAASSPRTGPATSAPVPHGVALFFNAPFYPSIEVSMVSTLGATGPAPVHDLASRDGFGQAGRLGRLQPGVYTLKLTSPSLPGYALFEGEVEVDGRTGTSVTLGLVEFAVPPKSTGVVGKGIALEILEEATGRPVFKGPLAKATVPDSGGRDHERSLVLPLGSYEFSLTDLDPRDAVGIAPAEGRPGLVVLGKGNGFKLTREAPRTIVDLKKVLLAK